MFDFLSPLSDYEVAGLVGAIGGLSGHMLSKLYSSTLLRWILIITGSLGASAFSHLVIKPSLTVPRLVRIEGANAPYDIDSVTRLVSVSREGSGIGYNLEVTLPLNEGFEERMQRQVIGFNCELLPNCWTDFR